MKRASKKEGGAKERPASEDEEDDERKKQVSAAVRIAKLLERTRKLNRSLSQSVSRRSPVAGVLRDLEQHTLQSLADLLAGELTDAGVRCKHCRAVIISEAGLAVHSCAQVRKLPPGMDGVLVPVEGGRKRKCKLCGRYAGKTGDHACAMGFIMPVLYDGISITYVRDRYNTCDLQSAQGEELQSALGEGSGLWHDAMRTHVAVSIVVLPPSSRGQGAQPALAAEAARMDATSTMTYVAPSSHIVSGCEGMRFVPGKRSQTQSPRFFYHGAVIARAEAKTAAAAAAAMTRAFRCWQQERARASSAGAGGADQLAAYTASAALGRRRHLRMRVDLLVFGGMAYKLNHSCAPNMESNMVRVEAWDDTLAAVLRVPLGATPPAMHEELFWDYSAVCDDREEQMECLCGAPQCRGWLVRCKGRAAR